jgi:hypothetical protein
MLGLTGICNPNALQTATPGGIAGQAAGFWVACVVRPTALGSGNYWLTRIAAAAGWGLLQNGASTLVFRCANGVGTLVSSPNFTLTGLTNTIVGVVGVHDGTTVRLYANRAEVGSGTAITGFTAHSNRTYVGAAGSASAFLDFFGAAGGTGVPSASDVATWFDLVKANRQIQNMPGSAVTTNKWIPNSGATAPVDSVGSSNFSITGSLTLASVGGTAWSW